jgi:hypothetical protein
MDIATLKALSDTKLADNTNIHPSKIREVNDAIIDEIYVNRTSIEDNNTYALRFLPLNRGVITNLDITAKAVNFEYTVTGDLTLAKKTANLDVGDVIRVTLANAMPSTNYEVEMNFEANNAFNVSMGTFIWRYIIVSTTQFDFYIEQGSDGTNDVKAKIKVTPLD